MGTRPLGAAPFATGSGPTINAAELGSEAAAAAFVSAVTKHGGGHSADGTITEADFVSWAIGYLNDAAARPGDKEVVFRFLVKQVSYWGKSSSGDTHPYRQSVSSYSSGSNDDVQSPVARSNVNASSATATASMH